MRTHAAVFLVLIAIPTTLPAQRRIRFSPTYSSIALDDGSGASHSFSSLGGSVALLTGDDDETGLDVTRYGNLSTNGCERSLTFFGLEQNYYPVGPGGIAPFASTALGLARVVDADKDLLGFCGSALPTTQVGFGFGLGLRVSAGQDAAAMIEGRFFQVPNSAVQGLELRANVSLLVGTPRTTELLSGTLGPALSYLIPISGPLQARGPQFGVRFRRDTKKLSSVLGLEIDYSPFSATGSCSGTGCHENAVLFAPGYEASWRLPWGRIYGSIGPLLAGFFSQGPDRGVAQGAQGGLGVDLAQRGVLYNFNSRLLWFQPGSGGNVFAVQVGLSVAPAIRGP